MRCRFSVDLTSPLHATRLDLAPSFAPQGIAFVLRRHRDVLLRGELNALPAPAEQAEGANA